MKESKKKYDFSRQENIIAKNDLKKRIFFIGMLACIFGFVLTMVMQAHLASILSYVVGFFMTLAAYILSRKRKNQTELCIMLTGIYFAFVYIPIDWLVYDGLLGSTPYVSIVPLVFMVLALSKSKQKVMIPIYLVLLLSLTVYSFSREILINNSERLTDAINIAAAFFVCITMITYALMLVLGKLDRLYNRTLDDAIKDKLTGVLNRRSFDDLLAIAESKYLLKRIDYTIVMIDVDNFKEMNDKKGHAFGDLVLIRVADCIERSVRSVDYVLRYGGDEFLILLQNIPRSKMAAVFRRIEGFLHEEYLALGDIEVSLSRGYVRRKDCDGVDKIVQIADKRMYEYKHNHRKD